MKLICKCCILGNKIHIILHGFTIVVGEVSESCGGSVLSATNQRAASQLYEGKVFHG